MKEATMPNKLYQKYHTLGVYVDTWGWNEGVIPHVFLGLKIEYHLVNENFNGTLDDKSRKQYAVESKLEEHSKTTQMELIAKLTQEFENNEANKEKWIEQKDEAIYEELDEYYLFFRQGYKDITIPAKEALKRFTFYYYKQYKQALNEFIQSEISNIRDIEGFFGFAPVESKSNHWGKVYENNQYAIIK